jgi:hypothetical protein
LLVPPLGLEPRMLWVLVPQFWDPVTHLVRPNAIPVSGTYSPALSSVSPDLRVTVDVGGDV